MFSLFFSLVMSWILFPIGLFKSGLSFKGYAIDQDASTFRRIVNLGIGIFTGYLALSYLSDIQGYGKSAYHRFSDLDMSKLTLTDPFEEYIGFFPWLGHQIMAAWKDLTSVVDAIGLSDVSILGATFSAGTLSLAALIGLPLLVVLLLEMRIYRHRRRHRMYDGRMLRYMRAYDKIRKSYPRTLTDDQETEISEKASKTVTHIKDPGEWRDKFAPITGNGMFARSPFRDMDEKLFYGFLFVEGLLTPAITAAYAIIFFIPTLLIIGIWLLAIVTLLIAFMPFAWLYGNGMRVRMH